MSSVRLTSTPNLGTLAQAGASPSPMIEPRESYTSPHAARV